MKLIKTFVFLFLLTFTTHAFGKSNEYYQMVLTNVLTNCNSECQKEVFEQEIKYLFYVIFEQLLEKIRMELLDEKRKESKFI
jgi:hypothetical protein